MKQEGGAWRNHFHLMYTLLCNLHEDIRVWGTQSPNRRIKNAHRLFKLLPELALKSKHVNVTGTTVKELAKHVEIQPSYNVWTDCFHNVLNAIRNKDQVAFAWNLRTDRVTVSLLVGSKHKPLIVEAKVFGKKKTGKKKMSTQLPPEKICDRYTRLVCIDPGLRSIVTGVVGCEESGGEIVRMTSQEFKFLCQNKKFHRCISQKIEVSMRKVADSKVSHSANCQSGYNAVWY